MTCGLLILLTMKLQAQVGDETPQLEINRDGNRVFAKVDDRDYELDASEVEPNVFLLKHKGKVHEVYVSPTGGSYQVSIGGKDIDVRLIDPKRLRGTGSGTEHGDGNADIRTMMPGKVVRLIVNTGDSIEKGDGVLVVEAMKMQNELKSPKAGTVREIRVAEGETVAAGDVLAVIE